MQLAANLSTLYATLPVAERFAAARHDGFHHVEILAPYDQSPQWYAGRLRDQGLALALINTPPRAPQYPAGLAAQPGAQPLFQDAMRTAAAVCDACACPAVHVMAGGRDAQFSLSEQQDVLLENLRWAAHEFPQLRLQLEALNALDRPGYFYAEPAQVAAILERLDLPRVGMQFDFYHVVKQGLDLVEQIERHYAWVVHVQVAGAPERHEPDLDRDDLMAGFRALKARAYTGKVGLEYYPRSDVAAGLGWLQPLRDDGWLTP